MKSFKMYSKLTRLRISEGIFLFVNILPEWVYGRMPLARFGALMVTGVLDDMIHELEDE